MHLKHEDDEFHGVDKRALRRKLHLETQMYILPVSLLKSHYLVQHIIVNHGHKQVLTFLRSHISIATSVMVTAEVQSIQG